MKLSTLKTIAITSLATMMLGSVGIAQADNMTQTEAQAQIAKIEQALKGLTHNPLPDTCVDCVADGSNAYPFDLETGTNTRRINAPSKAPSVVPGCDPLPEFNFIGVDDQGLNNSDFFVMDLTVPEGNPRFIDYLTNGRHEGYDLEGLDSTNSPFASCLWATSGDNDDQRDNSECETGCLYKVHKTDGSLNLYGDICTEDADLVEVDAAAFRVNNALGWQELWGWAQHQGLFQMANPFPRSGMCGDGRTEPAIGVNMVCEYSADEPTSEPDKNKFNDLVVEDMTWVQNQGKFYIAIDQAIFTINPEGCGYDFVCINQTEIEGLEYLPDYDLLAVGLHSPDKRIAQSSVAALDLNDPTKNNVFCKFLPTNFPIKMDVEGLAYP